MAEKRSKSILGSLKKMLHRDPEKPSAPAPKKASGSTRKKSAAPAAEKRPPSADTAAAEAPAAQDAAADAKPDKKKTPNQPWYRHRQRW